jgi:signal transduction histidine kinase/CheY-like chemotaxis protein
MLHNDNVAWKLYLGFGGVLALLIGLLAFSLVSVSRLARTLEHNLDTYSILEANQELRAAMRQIHVGHWGYVLGGHEESLLMTAAGEQEFADLVTTLVEMTAGDPIQSARVTRAIRLNDDWRDTHREPVVSQRRSAGDSLDTSSLMLLGMRGQPHVDSLTATVDTIELAEHERLEDRAAQVASLKRATAWLIGLGGLFGLLAAAAFGTVGIRRSRALTLANRDLHEEVLVRQQAEEELGRVSRRNSLILEAAGEGICGLDLAGRITFLNPAAAQMLRVREGELLFASTGGATGADDSSGPGIPMFRTGPLDQAQVDELQRRDGSFFPVEYIVRPIVEEAAEIGTVLTFKDITERREIEKLKDEFVSVVSHELRTPLTSIRGSLGLLASGKLGTLEESGQRMLEIAAQNTDRLVRLINDILDIERIASGTITMEPDTVSVHRLVTQAVQTVQGVAEKGGIRLRVQPVNTVLRADGDRVVQVLTNLLSNAIKFSDAGSTVSLEAVEENGSMRFTVTDNGRGIPADKLESIFERFQQVDASDSREKGGTGLGLSIARSIVQQHGGDIWVESTPGNGSSFHFTIPLPETEKALRADSPSHTVLLCDDDEVTRDVVGARLRSRGYQVIAVASGAEAVEASRHFGPDTILLDLVMPGMDGCETMAALKSRPETRDIPIIIFSSTPPGEPNATLAAAADWVTKNAGEETLFRALEKALSRGTKIGRILLVEDDPDLAEVLTAMFERHGVQAVHADSYTEAVRQCEMAAPDLLVVDIVLREGDAYGLVDHLRRDNKLRSVPLVVYSALDLDDGQRSRLRLGPTEFMTKGRVSPTEFEHRVVALLDELCEKRKAVA